MSFLDIKGDNILMTGAGAPPVDFQGSYARRGITSPIYRTRSSISPDSVDDETKQHSTGRRVYFEIRQMPFLVVVTMLCHIGPWHRPPKTPQEVSIKSVVRQDFLADIDGSTNISTITPTSDEHVNKLPSTLSTQQYHKSCHHQQIT